LTNRHADPLLEAFAAVRGQGAETTLLVAPTRRATVGEVDGLSCELKALLQAAPIASGEIVGLAAPNGPGFVSALLALRSSGHPVLLIDAAAPAPERRRILAELGVGAVLSTKVAWPSGAGDFRLTRRGEGAGHESLGAEVALIKLTSGSTGQARGIAVSTRALIADDRALVQAMGLRRDDLFVAAVPFSHSYGFSSLVLPALLRGSTLVLPGNDGPFAPLHAAASCGATVFPSVPSYLSGLAKASVLGQLPASLRLVISAGGPLPAPAASRFRARFGQPIHVFYGASECGGITFDREGSAAERGTVGEPLEGVSVTLEPGAGENGSGGRVVVQSEAVAHCYLPTPDGPLAGGRFRSDDLGAWTGRELELLGKVSQVINVHGRKVNPRDVERVILELDGVDEVAVLPGGNETREWVEAVVACTAGNLSVQDVLSWCRSQLAPFKTPRKVVLVRSLPRDQRGKLGRAGLAALSQDSSSDS
jgi:acyl-coenzyme A synthetase/AMP-(fatty) acid ligase